MRSETLQHEIFLENQRPYSILTSNFDPSFLFSLRMLKWKEELRTVDDRVRIIVGVKDQVRERPHGGQKRKSRVSVIRNVCNDTPISV